MRVDKREFAWEFFQLMPRSNGNKSCMRVDESWQASFYTRVFSTLIYPDQTGTRVDRARSKNSHQNSSSFEQALVMSLLICKLLLYFCGQKLLRWNF